MHAQPPYLMRPGCRVSGRYASRRLAELAAGFTRHGHRRPLMVRLRRVAARGTRAEVGVSTERRGCVTASERGTPRGGRTHGAEGVEPSRGARGWSGGCGRRWCGAGSGNRDGARGAASSPARRWALVPRQNIGIQLYSLRDLQAAGVQSTIDLVGASAIPRSSCSPSRDRPRRRGAASWRAPTSEPSLRTSASTGGVTSSTPSSTRPRRWGCGTSASPGSSRIHRRRCRPIAGSP